MSARPKRRRKKPQKKPSARSPERLVAAHLLGGFRGTKERRAMRRSTGLSDDQIERALRSREVEEALRDALKTWARENRPALLRLLYDAARKGQAWAWRILMETTDLGEQLRAAVAAGTPDTTDAFVSTGFEQRLITGLRAIGKPAPTRSPDSPPSS